MAAATLLGTAAGSHPPATVGRTGRNYQRRSGRHAVSHRRRNAFSLCGRKAVNHRCGDVHEQVDVRPLRQLRVGPLVLSGAHAPPHPTCVPVLAQPHRHRQEQRGRRDGCDAAARAARVCASKRLPRRPPRPPILSLPAARRAPPPAPRSSLPVTRQSPPAPPRSSPTGAARPRRPQACGLGDVLRLGVLRVLRDGLRDGDGAPRLRPRTSTACAIVLRELLSSFFCVVIPSPHALQLATSTWTRRNHSTTSSSPSRAVTWNTIQMNPSCST